MTKEEYDKIVEPVAPFKEIEKKQPKTNVLPFLAVVFAAYEGKYIKPCVVDNITKEE